MDMISSRDVLMRPGNIVKLSLYDHGVRLLKFQMVAKYGRVMLQIASKRTCAVQLVDGQKFLFIGTVVLRYMRLDGIEIVLNRNVLG